MVFLQRQVPGNASDSVHALTSGVRHLHLTRGITTELTSEQAVDYMRLLSQLARCGLGAEGPTLLTGAAQG